jgi:hypothetical protein
MGILREMLFLLVTVLRFIVLFGVLFPLYGSSYLRLLINIVLGSKWNTDEMYSTFAAYCFYILVMGINGVTEAFVLAVSLPSAFSYSNIALVCSSTAFYLSVGYFTTQYGTSGVVIANIVGMIVRIACNGVGIFSYFNTAPQDSSNPESAKWNAEIAASFFNILPPLSEGLLMIALATITYYSSQYYFASSMGLKYAAIHIGVGALVFGALIGVFWRYHRVEYRQIMNRMKSIKVE